MQTHFDTNSKLERIIFDIKKIWDELNLPLENQLVIYSSYEAEELITLLAGKPYYKIDFNTSVYDAIVTEGSSYALQYYVGGIFISIIDRLRIMLSWTRDYDACLMFSLMLLLFIVQYKECRQLLLDNSYVSKTTIVEIFGRIYAIAKDMRQEVGDEFEAFENFNKIAAFLDIPPFESR